MTEWISKGSEPLHTPSRTDRVEQTKSVLNNTNEESEREQ